MPNWMDASHRTDRLPQWPRWGRKSGRKRESRDEPGIRLRTTNLVLPVALELLTPTMQLVVVEDLCWELANELWLGRRPKFWRRGQLRAWQQEKVALEAKRHRIATLARHGDDPLPPPDGDPTDDPRDGLAGDQTVGPDKDSHDGPADRERHDDGPHGDGPMA